MQKKYWISTQNAKDCPDCVDPATIDKNYIGSYVGPNNPKTNSGNDTYEVVPTNIVEYPAIGHDRRYDNLGIKGSTGLFLDARASGADIKFVGEEFKIATSRYLPITTRLQAAAAGFSLGLAALSKTLFAGLTYRGQLQIRQWYIISSVRVTNTPTTPSR